jgi:hypothetical protein
MLPSIYFVFNENYYDLKDGVAMGSSLAPTVAHYFMENFENQAVGTAPKRQHAGTGTWMIHVVYAAWFTGITRVSTS